MLRTITAENALRRSGQAFIDVRSPAEYAEDHLPEAVNLPLLSDEERSVVGRLYKQVSQDIALEKGKEFFQAKVPEFLRVVQPYKNKTIIINCWRGGMRSRAIAELLHSHGYNVFQLAGGYKAYRQYVRERLTAFLLKPKLVVLWGLTCSGKTNLLQKFPHSLDLEGLAQHRGSLYGALGLLPRSQKRFEGLLLQRLEQLQHEKYVLVEGESRKIGKVQLPEFLHRAMKSGIPVLVQRSLMGRATAAVEEYYSSPENIRKIREITAGLKKVISRKQQEQALQLLDDKRYEEATAILLKYYYDPLYSHLLKSFSFSLRFSMDDPIQAEAGLRNFMAGGERPHREERISQSI